MALRSVEASGFQLNAELAALGMSRKSSSGNVTPHFVSSPSNSNLDLAQLPFAGHPCRSEDG